MGQSRRWSRPTLAPHDLHRSVLWQKLQSEVIGPSLHARINPYSALNSAPDFGSPPMLHTLRRIVQEVATATNLDEALAISVRRVKQAMGVDACYISLADTECGEYVLMAADGLNPESVGRVRLGLNEGLAGLVGERKEPINLKDASAHPRFRPELVIPAYAGI